MKLYGSIASPYVARVVMFADLKGIELPMEAAPGGMGSDEYKAINPTGKIPALQVDGPHGKQTIAESTVIPWAAPKSTARIVTARRTSYPTSSLKFR